MSSKAPLRIVPLGGLGEFGLNCMVVERGNDAIAIDCGVMFPDAQLMGIDLVIPDITYLRELGDRFKGFVLTHGHEDHLGALPYVWGEFDVPVFATRFTEGLLRERLGDHPRLSKKRIEMFGDGDRFQLGGFDIEGIPVTHSIVDAVALAMRTEGEIVIHSGDFKIDETPIDGRAFATERFRALGDEGVKLLLSDSTNVETEGSTGSERLVRGMLEPMFAATKGRLFVATFASHIHRVAAIMALAHQFGRKVVILGRRMESNTALANQTGHLGFPGDLLVDAREAQRMKPSEVCYLLTGSQGEPRSALSRIAFGNMQGVVPGVGDAVIFSSKVIPGNERPIGAVIDQLYRMGCEVYYPKFARAHVSGHACKEELRTMLELVRPEYFVPVHGEYRNLVHHARLAVETGVEEQKCFRMTDGDVLEIDGQGGRRAGIVTAGRVLIDGGVVGIDDESVMRDRRNISRDGMVLAVLEVAQQSGAILSGPEFLMRGVVTGDQAEPDVEPLRQAVVNAIDAMPKAAIRDIDELSEEVRLAVRRFFRRTHGSRPVVVPYVVEL
ncbi:MAG: ribonuclease J [Candidatus Binatia bacterium]